MDSIPAQSLSNDEDSAIQGGSERLLWVTSQPWWAEVQGALRDLAATLLQNERPGHTLQPTALLHEAFLRLSKHRNGWSDRAAFSAAAATALRRVLVDYARTKKAAKRPPESRRVSLDASLLPQSVDQIDLVDLDGALLRLAEIEPRLAQLVEVRFFGGLTEEEAAEVLGISRRKIQLDWRTARAWLRQALNESE
ncbi:MAG: sigma-70 family RNA polymerase sigma factor [Planctomycetes bacterium]|nr:sigma-70 family RNA polymerase sigma factor [Planctomycetota bacterium]